MPEIPKWLEKAKSTYRFHRSKVIADEKWTIHMTAKALRRSLGSICEDLLIANWSKTHETKIESFKYAYQALEWIRTKQKEFVIGDID